MVEEQPYDPPPDRALRSTIDMAYGSFVIQRI